MWLVPDNLLHVFFNINAPFGSDYFVLISQHNLGGKLLYSHSLPPYLPRGKKWLYSHFSGRKIYYIAIFPPIQVRGKYGYIAIFPGGKWLYNTCDDNDHASSYCILIQHSSFVQRNDVEMCFPCTAYCIFTFFEVYFCSANFATGFFCENRYDTFAIPAKTTTIYIHCIYIFFK